MKKCSTYLCLLCAGIHLWLGQHLMSWVPRFLEAGYKIHKGEPPWAEFLRYHWWPYGAVAICAIGLVCLLFGKIKSSHVAYGLVVLQTISTVLMFWFTVALIECSHPPFSN
jgi:hypothetical protein